MTFDVRQPLMEDTLWWKTTFDERQQKGRPQVQVLGLEVDFILFLSQKGQEQEEQ